MTGRGDGTYIEADIGANNLHLLHKLPLDPCKRGATLKLCACQGRGSRTKFRGENSQQRKAAYLSQKGILLPNKEYVTSS